MNAAPRLAIEWDPETASEFRSALEHALARLLVDAYDVSETDPDPDGPAPARLRVVASSHSRPTHREPGVLVLATQAASASVAHARLETGDIDHANPRWSGFLRRLGDLLGRPGLARLGEVQGDAEAMKAWALEFPGDPLAQDIGISLRTDVLLERAAQADTDRDRMADALRVAERDRSDAVRLGRMAASEAARLAGENAKLTAEMANLKAAAEEGAYPLAGVDPAVRDLVLQARQAALRARQAAAAAEGAARRRTGARTWTSTVAVYDGETRNELPDGLGVMWFGRGQNRFAGYQGEFVGGRRHGAGVGRDAGGSLWSGDWVDDAACGLGVLEAADGRRFEGRVRAMPSGPVREEGWIWPASPGTMRDGGVLRARPPAQITDRRQGR